MKSKLEKTPLILICDEDSFYHVRVKQALKRHFNFISAHSSNEALTFIREQAVDLLLLDIRMHSEGQPRCKGPDAGRLRRSLYPASIPAEDPFPFKGEGLQSIPRFLVLDPDLAIVVNTSVCDFATVREAMRLGASDYVVKDSDSDDLLPILRKVIEKKSLLKQQKQQKVEARINYHQSILIGESPPMRALRNIIEKAKKSRSNVVIYGETGTGKELVARQLRHQLSDQSLAPFLAVDSATIQSSMAESLLFGHEKGAFTGADRITKGIFEEANRGVVYFDEISNMPLDIQAKLLRVLQEKEIMRLGSSRTINLDFRVICATNRDLEELVDQGEFKADLLQRLNVIPVTVPPLRSRCEDMPNIIEHFIQKQGNGGPALRFTERALGLMKSYPWPGNVRELGNLVSYLSSMADGPIIDSADLPPKFHHSVQEADPDEASREAKKMGRFGTFNERMAFHEKAILQEEYCKHNGNISKIAGALQIDRSHLHTKLTELGIHMARQRQADTQWVRPKVSL